MLRSKRTLLIGWIVTMAWLAGGIGERPLEAAPYRGKYRPEVPPVAKPEPPPPKETVILGDDHEANIAALQHEKLDLLRQREEGMQRAFTAGRITQRELDHASLDVLRLEIEMLDRPHLRIAAYEKLVTILKRIEAEAEQNFNDQPRTKDPHAQISAHGRYVSAKVTRLNAQIALEREKIAQAEGPDKPEVHRKSEKPK